MFDKIETVPGSPVALVSPPEGGEWRIKPTPSLFAEPSKPRAKRGRSGGRRGHGTSCFLLRATIFPESDDEVGIRVQDETKFVLSLSSTSHQDLVVLNG